MKTKRSGTAAWLAAIAGYLEGIPAFDELVSILTSGESPVATDGLPMDICYIQNVDGCLTRRSDRHDH